MPIADREQQFARGEAYLDDLARKEFRILLDREVRLQELQAARSVFLAQVRGDRDDQARLLHDNPQLRRELSDNEARIR